MVLAICLQIGLEVRHPRFGIVHLALLLLAPIASCLESDSHLMLMGEPTNSKFYVLAQKWPAEECLRFGMDANICADARSAWKQSFVLSGLCSHGDNQTFQYCGGAPFDVNELPLSTKSSLSDAWPQLTYESSWDDAWWRCGTCTALSQSGYFETALTMRRTLATRELYRFLSQSVGKMVNANQVVAAFGFFDIALVCNGNALSSVYTCWSGYVTDSTSRRIDCPLVVRERQNCGSRFYINSFPDKSKQSAIATALWLVQYTTLFVLFGASWRADCRSRVGTSQPAFTKRTGIQIFAMIHAGTGVFSELFAIAVDAGGETGLRMWPWLSMMELVANLTISYLMIFWYTRFLFCFGITRLNLFGWACLSCLWSFLYALAILLWAILYLIFNIQAGMNTKYIKQMELNPTDSPTSLAYYIISSILELHCFILVNTMRTRIGSRLPSIKKVFILNLISFIDSVMLVAVHTTPVEQFLPFNRADIHPWTLGALFFIRYVVVSCLIEPVTSCETENEEFANALHLGPRPSYTFSHGKALVICNSNYDSGFISLRNEIDGDHFKLAMKYIGFDSVDVRCDVRSDEIETLFEKFLSNAEEDNVDGIAFAFSGHGEQDCIIGVNGQAVDIPWLKSQCCSQLEEKPKFFFFECCRGGSDETRRPRRNEQSWVVRLPQLCGPVSSANANFLECHATAKYFGAYSQRDGSGPFAETIMRTFRDEANYGDHDIEVALKKAGAEVAAMKLGRCRRECPTYTSTLHRRFILRRSRVEGLSSQSGSAQSPFASGTSLPPLSHGV